MNMHTVLNEPALLLHSQLQQLQGLQIWELRTQTHRLLRQYPNCTVYGPELIGDRFVTEIRDEKNHIMSEHALPIRYCNEW